MSHAIIDPTKSEIYYQEIQCRTVADVSIGFLMSRAMNQVHLELVRISAGKPSCPIGISFPGYCIEARKRLQDQEDCEPVLRLPPIGDRIRLFSREFECLENLKLASSLVRMNDYLEVGEVRQLKRKNIGWYVFKRHQPNGSVDKLIRRYMKRRGVPLEEATKHFAQPRNSTSNLPYLDMISFSSKRRYRLFIERRSQDPSQLDPNWAFSSYGLSSSTAVPDF